MAEFIECIVGMAVVCGGIGVFAAVLCGCFVLADKTARVLKRRGVKPGILRKTEVFSKAAAFAFLCVSFAAIIPLFNTLSASGLCFLCAVMLAVTAVLSVVGMASEKALMEADNESL